MSRAKPEPSKPKAKPKALRVPKPGLASLNYQRRMFVSFYLGISSGNATDAARRAGYRFPRVTGCQLLTIPNIRAAIEAKLDELSLSTDEILSRLSEIAAANLEDFIELLPGGGFKVDLRKAEKAGKLHLVRVIRRTAYGEWIELHNAMDALDRLARYRGMYGERTVQSGSNDRAGHDPIDVEAAERAVEAALRPKPAATS